MRARPKAACTLARTAICTRYCWMTRPAFLRKIVRGGADDSYGIQVAKLAGIPYSVTERAKEILKELTDNAEREKMAVRQLSFEDAYISVGKPDDSLPDEIRDELSKIDVNVLTPIEALNILYKLKSMI